MEWSNGFTWKDSGANLDFIFHNIKTVLLLIMQRLTKLNAQIIFLSKNLHKSDRAVTT